MFADRVLDLTEIEAKVTLLSITESLACQVATNYVNETMYANELERQKNRILDEALSD